MGDRGTGRGGQAAPADGGAAARQGGGRWDDDLAFGDDVGAVRTGRGDDVVALGAGARVVSLGTGDDRLSADGPVGSLRAGRGDDGAVLRGGFEIARMGTGDDRLTVEGDGRAVRLGQGDDVLTVDGHVADIRGGRGLDVVSFERGLGAFDVAVHGRRVTLSDRLTGEETVLRGVERFSFDGEELDLGALRGIFAPDGPPAIRVSEGTQLVSVDHPDPTVSVVWDRAAQVAVVGAEGVGPTVASRAYALVHTAIYDAWAALDPVAQGIAPDAEGDDAALAAAVPATEEAAAEAMSFAAHAVLSELFPASQAMLDAIMTKRYGLDPTDASGAAARLGLDAAEDLMTDRRGDGSNQANGYADTSGHVPHNPGPLDMRDLARWTPESVPLDPEDDEPEQTFLTAHWGGVDGFALPTGPDGDTDYDVFELAPPQPFFAPGQEGAVLDAEARTVTLGAPATVGGVAHGAGAVLPVTPALVGPVIAERFVAQAEALVEMSASLDDRDKIVAEFWEDGGGTAFPPGTFMSFAEFVSARDGHDQATDAALFLAMGNAMLDAGVATWWAKVEHDYARPVRVIRELGELGLIGEPGVDEVTGEEGHVIEAWGGIDPETGLGRGTRTILAENFVTFQRPGADPSPPFAEYTSGHSAFSAAGAAVLRGFTGSDAFGGSVAFAPGVTGFEAGVPEIEEVLAWRTFTEAADEAGLSRLYGGIHFEDGDLHGRALGRQVGEAALDLALEALAGAAGSPDAELAF